MRYHTWPSTQAQRGGQHPLVHPDSAALSRNGATTLAQVFASLFAITGSFLGPQRSLPCPVPSSVSGGLRVLSSGREDFLILLCPFPALWPAGCESRHGPPREGPSDCLPREGNCLASPESSSQQHADAALPVRPAEWFLRWSPRHRLHTAVLPMLFLCCSECPSY